MATIFTALGSESLYIPRGQALMKIKGVGGTVGFLNLGSCTANLNLSPQKTDIRTNEDPNRPITDTVVTSLDGKVTINAEMVRKELAAIIFAGNDNPLTQTASAGVIQTFATVAAGQIYSLTDAASDLSVSDVTNVIVTDGTGAVHYVAGINVNIDAPTGMVEVLSIPAGADTNLKVTYDLPAITDPTRTQVGILQNPQIWCELVIRQNNLRGASQQIEIFNAIGSASGDVAHNSDTGDTIKLALEFTLRPDSSKPNQFAYGRVKTII